MVMAKAIWALTFEQLGDENSESAYGIYCRLHEFGVTGIDAVEYFLSSVESKECREVELIKQQTNDSRLHNLSINYNYCTSDLTVLYPAVFQPCFAGTILTDN